MVIEKLYSFNLIISYNFPTEAGAHDLTEVTLYAPRVYARNFAVAPVKLRDCAKAARAVKDEGVSTLYGPFLLFFAKQNKFVQCADLY